VREPLRTDATLSQHPLPAPAIAAVPATTPFVAPEELARRVGRTSLVRLGANESAFGPSPRAVAAMQAALPLVSLYGDPESLDLREALAAKHACKIENIVVGSGVDELLGLMCRTYGAPGDRALMSYGSYPTFRFHVIGHGLELVTVPPFADGAVDIDAMLAAARERRPKIVYLANPDNPSGSFVDRDVVARLQAGLPPDALFVLDEAYADFVTGGTLLPDPIDERTIRLRTFSKAYGMAGARIGYALASREAIAVFQKIRNHFGVNRTAQIGALAALEDRAFVAGVTAEVVRGRDEYHAFAATLGVRTLPSQTNFVCFEIGTRQAAEQMMHGLLERGVFVRKPGEGPINGYIRVTVGTPDERMLFYAQFAAALDALRERVS
jgi:histidinol-phosphate aminotransferase